MARRHAPQRRSGPAGDAAMTSPPLWSFAGPSRSLNEPTLAEALRALWRWIRPQSPTWREVECEARLVDALAAELGAEDEPPPAPRRARR